jgi:hypothetical protein
VLKRFGTGLGGQSHRGIVAGVPVRVIRAGKSVAVRYANVNGRLIVTSLPSGIAFAKNGGKVLADSREYQDAARSASLPAKPQVVLYVDIHSTIPVLRRLGNVGIPTSVERNLKPLRSAVEYAVRHSHEIQVSFFLRIR